MGTLHRLFVAYDGSRTRNGHATIGASAGDVASPFADRIPAQRAAHVRYHTGVAASSQRARCIGYDRSPTWVRRNRPPSASTIRGEILNCRIHASQTWQRDDSVRDTVTQCRRLDLARKATLL